MLFEHIHRVHIALDHMALTLIRAWAFITPCHCLELFYILSVAAMGAPECSCMYMSVKRSASCQLLSHFSRLTSFEQVLEEVVTEEAQQNGHTAESEPASNGTATSVGGSGSINRQQLLFCERFVEFLIDLMSQAPTRRYSHALLEDKAVLIKCRMSDLFQHEQGSQLPSLR